jgi:hypothetical protein
MSGFAFPIRAGTTEHITFQLFLNGLPCPLGSPSAMTLTRRKVSDGSSMTAIDLVVVDAATGKIRWEPTAGQTVAADLGYRCTIVIAGGTNPGTWPSHGYEDISVEP